jgi:hypothetical protein
MSNQSKRLARYTNPQRSRKHTCPECGGGVCRVPRRLIDRLINLFTPVQRYRCLSMHCAWQGNMPGIPRAPEHPSTRPGAAA